MDFRPCFEPRGCLPAAHHDRSFFVMCPRRHENRRHATVSGEAKPGRELAGCEAELHLLVAQLLVRGHVGDDLDFDQHLRLSQDLHADVGLEGRVKWRLVASTMAICDSLFYGGTRFLEGQLHVLESLSDLSDDSEQSCRRLRG